MNVTVLAAPQPIRVKGLVFRQTMQEVERLCGREAADRALSLMPADLRDALDAGGVVAHGWYSVEWQRAMWDAIRVATDASPDMLRLIGHEAVLGAVSTVYRPFLKLLSPATMAQVGAKLWGRVYEGGGYLVTSAEQGRMSIRFLGCTGFDRTMWLVTTGTVEAFAKLAGARRISIRIVAGGRDGDDWAELVGRWE